VKIGDPVAGNNYATPDLHPSTRPAWLQTFFRAAAVTWQASAAGNWRTCSLKGSTITGPS